MSKWIFLSPNMPNKSYTVMIHLDFNTIDCPGVWLCPKGKAFLKICLFGIADLTRDVDPFFPLVIRERFIFEKDFKDVSSVFDLHDKIGRSIISIELLQCPVGSPTCVKLAIFNSLLSDLLHPYSSCFARPPDASGIELLFTTCKIFPGIIAPKADVAVKVVVSDMHGNGGKPTVRRMPLNTRGKGNTKRQQAVCHSKNGLTCGCFTKSRERSQPDSGGGDRAVSEPSAHAGKEGPHGSSKLQRPQTSTFYPKPPPGLSSQFQGHHGQYRDRKPIEPLLQANKKSSTPQNVPDYVEEPDMEWAKFNLGVAVGPGEYKGKEDNALFSAGWDYVWDGQKSDKKNKRQTVLNARRQFRELEPDKKGDPTEGRGDEYGNDAIRREMDECTKLLEEYNSGDVIDDPELRYKYENCVKNMEWLQQHGSRSQSTEKIMTSTSTEEPLQVTNRRVPEDVPCHGKCCKCKEEQLLIDQDETYEQEGQVLRSRKPQNRVNLSPIDENSEWFPRKQWEKERQEEVKRLKERVWERELITHEQERRGQQNQERDKPTEPSQSNPTDQERRASERQKRRMEEVIRQRRAREEIKRQTRLNRESSSDQEPVESSDSSPEKKGQNPEAPRQPLPGSEIPGLKRQSHSPERVAKPSTDPSKPSRASPMPYNGKKQEQQAPRISTKRSPTLPQPPRSSNTRTVSTQKRSPSPIKRNVPEDGDRSAEDCDCNLCEQYQELYNPSAHPCPRFRRDSKKNNNQQPSKNTATAGARKLVSSRKRSQGRPTILTSKKQERDHQNAQCGFSTCDGPINSEMIEEEFNAIRKFYYGK